MSTFCARRSKASRLREAGARQGLGLPAQDEEIAVAAPPGHLPHDFPNCHVGGISRLVGIGLAAAEWPRSDATDDPADMRRPLYQDATLLRGFSAQDANASAIVAGAQLFDRAVVPLNTKAIRPLATDHAHIANVPLVDGAGIGPVALDGRELLRGLDAAVAREVHGPAVDLHRFVVLFRAKLPPDKWAIKLRDADRVANDHQHCAP